MNFDLDTVLKAIQLVGPATQAARDLYEGFRALTDDSTTQEELKTRYEAAKRGSDAAHDDVQTTR